MKYRVFENVLPKQNWASIVDFVGINGEHKNQASFIYVPHKATAGVEQNDGYGFQFVHWVFDVNGVASQIGFELIRPLIYFLSMSSIVRIKINANPRTPFPSQETFHIDHDGNGPFLSAVYYINDNNGGTQFKDGPRIQSIANRLLVFDGDLEHAAVTAIDVKTRFVVNFCFYATRNVDIFDPNYYQQ